MWVIDLNVVPPGGWRYVQPETSSKLQAPNYQDLRSKVREHRLSNSLAVEGIDDQIHAYMCAQQDPGSRVCTPTPPTKSAQTPKASLTVSDALAFLSTVGAFFKSGGKLVEQEQADTRASVCVSCPLNTKVAGCRPCVGLARKVFDLLGARKTPHDSNLQQCGVCGCVLAAKVWLPIETVHAVTPDTSQFPDHCWIVQESEPR